MLIFLLSLAAPTPVLVGLVLCIAFLYASVGFGGASGYLAVMSLFAIPPAIAASTALSLNVVVAGVAFVNFTRHGHLRPGLLWPFVLTSLPAAFLGGLIKLDQITYQLLLNAVLLYLGLRLLFANNPTPAIQRQNAPPWLLALASGAMLGLLSGMLGIGGGIFLSPLILLAGWGDAKQAAASSAGFIFINSLGGLAGRAWGANLQFGALGGLLILFGLIGGLAGSLLGVRVLSTRTVRRLLGVVMLVAVAWFILGVLR